MKKIRENLANFRKNRKGFTLVELIIVVAIIAVLAAVLAPQYMQYVERSRQSNDLQVATSIMRAATAAVADPNNDVSSASTVEVRWSTGGTGAPLLFVSGASTASNYEVCEAIAEVMGWAMHASLAQTAGGEAADAQSAAGNGQDFEFTIEMATGNIEIDAGSDDWETEIGVNP